MDGVREMSRASSAFPEWFDIKPSTPLRQGDVLEAVVTDTDRWRQTLVVLTADCDLAHSKHGGALTCVPLLRSSDYLLSFRAERLRDGLVGRLVVKLLNIYGQVAEDAALHISEERMRSWLAEEENPHVLCTALDLSGTAADQFVSAARCARSLLTERDSSLTEAIRSLAAAKLELGDAKQKERAANAVANEFASALKDLPGDALFLNEVSALHVDGYVAYLRRVIELDDACVALTTSQLPGDARYVRISRLQSPYIYALTQQFGSVFSSIGLPDAYENARNAIVERVRLMEGSP